MGEGKTKRAEFVREIKNRHMGRARCRRSELVVKLVVHAAAVPLKQQLSRPPPFRRRPYSESVSSQSVGLAPER